MPPKAKFTKEEIIKAALGIIKAKGTDALTARELGRALGSSARPIFTVFQSMDEVRLEAVRAARQLYDEKIGFGLCQSDMPAFKCVGIQYIQFALREPKLFQLLFMLQQAEKPSVMSVLPVIDDNYRLILESVQTQYSLSKPDAERLYRHLWIYTHGIAVLCATNMCSFTAEEISSLLTEVCIAVLKEIKAGR